MRTPANASERALLDPHQPQHFLVERERASDGKIVSVATIFLTNRECQWRCLYCDLWKNTLTTKVPPGAIPAQIAAALAHLAPATFTQVKLYNAGSFFDKMAIRPLEFDAIAAQVVRFERIIVECHPALVEHPVVDFKKSLQRAGCGNAPQLEVAMGLEIANDGILRKLNKLMTLEMFARAAKFLQTRDVAVRAFIMIKPPFVRDESSALAFAQQSIDFAFEHGVEVISLIPTRFGSVALQRLAERDEFSPPKLSTLEKALDYGVNLRRGRVFADLWDIEKFSDCPACFASRRNRLNEINLHQTSLPQIVCDVCRSGCQGWSL